MKTNMFSEYYEYKIKTVYQYSLLLTNILGVEKNKLWRRKKNIEKSLEKTINIYFDKYMKSSTAKKSLIECFLKNKNIGKYHLENEIMSIIDYFIGEKQGLEISNNENEIILMAVIIKIANELDLSTSPYKKNANNYNTIVTTEIEKYNKIDFFNLIDDGKKNMKLLVELVKTNVRKERKIFDLLTSNTSFNRYIDISKSNVYYLAQYNYKVASLDKYDKYGSKLYYESNKIDDKFVNISADLIVVTLMKQLSVRGKLKTFFLPVKGSYFKNDETLQGLLNIYNNKIVKRNVILLINYNDFSKNVHKTLNKLKCDYYIYCGKNSIVEDGKLLNGCDNYLVSNDFYKTNKKVINKWKLENVNILKENFDGVVLDRQIVEEK